MKKFNLKKKASSGDYVIGDKMLDKNRKDMNLSTDQQDVASKNINLSLPVKDKDNTIPFNKQLEAERKEETEVSITESKMDDKVFSVGDESISVTPINVKSEELNQKKQEDFKKAENAAKTETEFWDKYVGVQLEGEGMPTKVKKNIPESASQLGNHPDRFKGENIEKLVMASIDSIKDADAMLFHIYATAAKQDRDLNSTEKQQITDINSGKMRIMSQMAQPVRRSLEHTSDPIIKKDEKGAGVYEADGTKVDEFKSCEDAKANYPEAEVKQAQKWQTAKVFTKAPGFGPGKEVEENKIITVRPEETSSMALKREGFNPQESRIEIIDR
jgi:hypothetical protein